MFSAENDNLMFFVAKGERGLPLFAPEGAIQGRLSQPT